MIEDFNQLKEAVYLTAAVMTIYPVSPALAIASVFAVVYYLIVQKKNNNS
ncbi:MAG: hypothetical protein F6K45_22940 [Kamptonema sp. SIO1D9]|nr:hypothetical protein [Kamptonema sp. SIO1D9]